jgi:hypothetical protein
MADVAPIPFINFGESQARQAQAGASANAQNQEAQKTALDNQFTQAAMPLMMRALHDYDGGGAPMPNPADTAAADSSGVSGVPGYGGGDPNSDTNLRNRAMVTPFTPQEQASLGRAAILSGKMPGLLQMEQYRRDQRIALQTQQNQVRNGNLFDGMRAVTDADPGKAMGLLAATNMAPDTVQMLAKQFGDDKDGADQAAREYARHVAGAAHQWSGREAVKQDDGNFYDKQSGFQVPGTGHVGMSDAQWSEIAKSGMVMDTVPTGDGDSTMQIPHYKNVMGQNGSLDAYVMQVAASKGHADAHPSNTGAPRQVAKEKATAAVADAQKSATPAQQRADKATQYTDARGNPDPVMTKAMADKDYDINIPKYKFGTKPPSETIQAKQLMGKNAASLTKDAGDTVNAQRAALVMYQATQDTLNKGNYDPSLWDQKLAEAARYIPGGGAIRAMLGTGDYQKIAKQLGMAALQSGKGIFQRMTQQEANWLKTELNPSPGMEPGALRDLIGMNIKQSQYVIDSANRAGKYVGTDPAHPTKNPDKFAQWNQQYYPMQDIVKEDKQASPGEKYDKPEDVRDAVRAKKITREQGIKILQTSHGMQ